MQPCISEGGKFSPEGMEKAPCLQKLLEIMHCASETSISQEGHGRTPYECSMLFLVA
jgi:hypothetical protein